MNAARNKRRRLRRNVCRSAGAHRWLHLETLEGRHMLSGTPEVLLTPNNVHEIADVGGDAFFAGDGQLWQSDGTVAGTTMSTFGKSLSMCDILQPFLFFIICCNAIW